MGLSWRQGPLSGSAVGHFLTADPLPERLLFAEQLRRRMRVRFGGAWIADSENAVLLHEPGRYPVAYFPRGDVDGQALTASGKATRHKDLGDTAWYAVHVGDHTTERAASELTGPPEHPGGRPDRRPGVLRTGPGRGRPRRQPPAPGAGQNVMPHGIDRGLDVAEAGEAGETGTVGG